MGFTRNRTKPSKNTRPYNPPSQTFWFNFHNKKKPNKYTTNKKPISKTIHLFYFAIVFSVCTSCYSLSEATSDNETVTTSQSMDTTTSSPLTDTMEIFPDTDFERFKIETMRERQHNSCREPIESSFETNCRTLQNDMCHSNTECGSSGFCTADYTEPCSCYYNECHSDRDCLPNEICLCSYYDFSINNICTKGCRSSASCATGFKCIFGGISTCYPDFGELSYFCQTSRDLCKHHNECPEPHNGITPLCLYSKPNQRFECIDIYFPSCDQHTYQHSSKQTNSNVNEVVFHKRLIPSSASASFFINKPEHEQTCYILLISRPPSDQQYCAYLYIRTNLKFREGQGDPRRWYLTNTQTPVTSLCHLPLDRTRTRLSSRPTTCLRVSTML